MPEIPTARDSVALLQYTSGATGCPKGVTISHQNILHNQSLIKAGFRHPKGSTVVGWLPTFHDMGLIGNVIQPLYIGGRCVLMSPSAFLQRPMRWLQLISDEHAYTSGAPNFAYDLCVAKKNCLGLKLDLQGWHVAFNGAEPIRAETMERFAAAFAEYGFDASAFYPCYGLAEATLIVSGALHSAPITISSWSERSLTTDVAVEDRQGHRLVSCGSVLGDQELVIVDSASGVISGERAIGEICVTGPSVANGYWSDVEGTARTFRVHSNGRRYLHTGDRGFIDRGHLYVIGRDQEVLNLFGRKYWAGSIELAAERAGREFGVGRCGVYVVATKWLPELWIYCECENTRRIDNEIDLVVSRIKEAVSLEFDLSASVKIVPVGTLPRTSSGKIRRDQLPENLAKEER